MNIAKIKTGLAVGVFAAVSLSSLQAAACGESLFRVGKGVTYRAHTAPLPGSVIVIGKTEANRAFAKQLADAGHHVQVAGDAIELASMLNAGDVDVVLAAYGDHDVVERQVSASGTHAKYLPVTTSESESDEAKKTYGKTLSDGDSFTDFLKAIHRTLKHA